ncbi:2-hydroxy-3-oxopropionate reductase [Catalinimonas sp. 4WD22]|uniref:2-hydroxy-3-oxopropionate reductase n=1 Tax=Catalinimonas locisalis TaxID=3133978 RepID=UPI003101511D
MEKIGFIGLGIMGKPMALNLIKAGYALSVLKQSNAANALKEAGAKTCASSKELAQENDIIITMLPDSPEVKEVVLSEGGVLEGIRKGSLFIDMSTIAPSAAQEIYALMKEKGVEALDAPVSGGQVGAESGTVSFMVGGSEEAFQRAKPLFEVMGKNVVRIGEAGAGQTTKACNQIIVGMTIQAVAEAFTLAKKAGVDLAKMREALLGGFAQSRILDLHGQRIIDQNFQPGFKIKLHRKDMNIALQASREFSVPLYGSAQVAAHMDAILAQGNGELDHSAIAMFMEQLSIHES